MSTSVTLRFSNGLNVFQSVVHYRSKNLDKDVLRFLVSPTPCQQFGTSYNVDKDVTENVVKEHSKQRH